MKTYIALLRGINVSGQKKIPMAELRELFSGSGLENVQTYIQSGNVLFQSSEDNLQKLELKIHQAIKSHFDFDVPVVVKTHEDLQSIFDGCPFSEEKKKNSYFTFLFESPKQEAIEVVSGLSFPNEEFIITPECIYFYSAIGYGKAKCSNNFFERKLKIRATARNYKTLVKLLALSEAN
ncbi:DUF1697 domain-containing protein [Pseudotamlana carrageenivorans]|uniref:DUF1697 domain-containing protein n=1 Tax=Pseudotamlana carrageenivorans TaxID=2069432 RepID=A0A2I7SHY3_9FLAO|nr:DUF1697 domain-containing protein [Tamlana carrageenivorans]AUS05516.1 hypothetical protein C1A40_08570 [Tamlana carrageenivorans]